MVAKWSRDSRESDRGEGRWEIGYWILAIGYWRLAIGYWLLDIGDGRLEMGDGRWEIGDWRWAIGDWRLEIGDIIQHMSLRGERNKNYVWCNSVTV